MTAYVEETPDYASRLRLDGRHVVVIGAGQGIGRQTALAAAALGAQVSCIDTEAERARAVAEETKGLALVGDATERADVRRMFDQATERFGPPKGLVDIVGIAQWRPLREIDDATWQRGLDLNLKHAFLAMQEGARVMTEGGAMAFVASISGLRSAPNHAAYGAAKAGLMNLVGTAALELGPDIRVNAVAPGQTLTPRMAVRHSHEEGHYEKWAKKVPLGRVGRPYDIASALIFFISDLSSWVTGQTLVVDGGTGRRFQYEG